MILLHASSWKSNFLQDNIVNGAVVYWPNHAIAVAAPAPVSLSKYFENDAHGFLETPD